MEPSPPKTMAEAVARAIEAFRCEVCGGREVACVDNGGEPDDDEPWAGVEISAWQCQGCGLMMGVDTHYPDEADE